MAMEPRRLKPVVPELPRLVRYGKILFSFAFSKHKVDKWKDNFAILVGVIRRHATLAESAVAPRLFTAFIRGLKSRGILRRRIINPVYRYSFPYNMQICAYKHVSYSKLKDCQGSGWWSFPSFLKPSMIRWILIGLAFFFSFLLFLFIAF